MKGSGPQVNRTNLKDQLFGLHKTTFTPNAATNNPADLLPTPPHGTIARITLAYPEQQPSLAELQKHCPLIKLPHHRRNTVSTSEVDEFYVSITTLIHQQVKQSLFTNYFLRFGMLVSIIASVVVMFAYDKVMGQMVLFSLFAWGLCVVLYILYIRYTIYKILNAEMIKSNQLLESREYRW